MEIPKDVNTDEYSRLPKQIWWGNDYLYRWRGFWFRLAHLQGIANVTERFDPAPGDVVLASYPKTGTTWMKALLHSIVHRGDFSSSLRDTHPHELIPVMELRDFSQSSIQENASATTNSCHASTRILHTHIPFSILAEKYDSSACRVIYVTRNPKDTLVSLWHFVRASDAFEASASLDDLVDKFCSGVVPYGAYYDHVLEYWKESMAKPEKFLFVTYEELKANPRKQIERMAEFLGHPFEGNDDEGPDEIARSCSFNRMSKYDANKSGDKAKWLGLPYNAFFRKGEVGDHKNFLNKKMIEKIDEKTAEKFYEAGFMYGV